ncbi:MAG: FAD-binding protein, partial [Brevundimonas sp.]
MTSTAAAPAVPPSRALAPDVLIAGGGLAGATLALALKQGGLTPLVIDPQPPAETLAPTFDGRSTAVAFS